MSKFFTIKELTQSKYNIKNEPNEEQTLNLYNLIDNCLDPLRIYFKIPIKVFSGFRSPELNTRLKGKEDSQHLEGKAADLFLSINDEKFYSTFFILAKQLNFDELRLERKWSKNRYHWRTFIHISYNENNNRRLVVENRIIPVYTPKKNKNDYKEIRYNLPVFL